MKFTIEKKIKKSFCLSLFLSLCVSYGIIDAQITQIDFDSMCLNCPTSNPDASAILEIRSTNQGILIPRVANTSSITNPAEALLVYDNSSSSFKYFDGLSWQDISLGSAHINFTNVRNSLIGVNAGISNTGFDNTSLGFEALKSNVAGYTNTAIGSKAMQENITGYDNTAVGNSALRNNISSSNTALGAAALYQNVIGGQNTAVGRSALSQNISGNENISIGYASLFNNDIGSRNLGIGSFSLFENKNGFSNIAIGTHALYSNINKSNLVAVGDSALYNNGNVTSSAPNSMANTGVGSKAMFSNTNGYHNTATGFEVMYSNISGRDNTAMGSSALYTNASGVENVAMGKESMYNNNNGHYNTGIGRRALYQNTSGNLNVALGYSSFYTNTSGSNNTAVGANALGKNTTGYRNTASGSTALYNNTSGNNNTAIGNASFYNGANYTNATAIGYAAQPTASDQVVIGNTSVTEIGGYVNWSNLSDARFKVDLKTDVPGLVFINLLQPITYQLDLDAIASFMEVPEELRSTESETRKSTIRQSGFLAQDVEVAASSIAYNFSGVSKPKSKKDKYGLRYAEFVVPLVKAVQELHAKNILLEEQNNALEERLQKIEALLEIEQENN